MQRQLRYFALPIVLSLVALPLAAASTVEDLSPLERSVRRELVTLPYYTVFDNFHFQVQGDEVTLRGQVNGPALKKSAERAVARIEGVSRVHNEIEVLPTSFQDDRIRRAAYFAIYGHSALNRYLLQAVPPIHIIVNNGHVTLEGVVNNGLEKTVANLQANSVNEVFSVTNNLRVEKPSKG